MCGLLILKHLRNISDKSAVDGWSENAYFQYLCGMQELVPHFLPYNTFKLVHFRKWIGEKGIKFILALSICVNDDKTDDQHHDTAFIVPTVQEKNATYPTNSKLHKKIVTKVFKIVKELNPPYISPTDLF